MPLLDGKYEIISERLLGSEQTLFEATAPDGAAVRIVWYEVTPEQEARFEHYRRTLKRLKRSERAAVYDVVSRPGAHYVAWRPPLEARTTTPDRELESMLVAAGFRPENADIRRDQRRPMVYGLAFDGSALPGALTATSGKPVRPAPVRTLEPPAWLVTVLVTVLLAVASIVMLRGGMAVRSNDRLVVVPALTGNDINEAARRLHGLGLVVDAVPLASERAAGTVLKSEPAAGSQLRPGRPVRLSYALPPGRVTPTEVPRVVARRYPEEAEQSLAETGLALGQVARIPAEQAEGLVISQSPAAGTVVGERTEIDLLVSAGPSELMTFVPDLTGMPLEEARYLARLAGLRPERIIEDAVPAGRGTAGTVVAQSLRPNQPIAREDAVLRLIVARADRVLGAVTAGLPSFVGLTPDEARELAGDLTLEIEEISDRALPEGVVDQIPSAATAGAEQVTLVVNVHPVPVPRPDVSARVREPEPRDLQYRWFVEPGIPEQVARIYATTLEGDRILLRVVNVRGGDVVTGTWRTRYPGPVRFGLTLNDQPYGGEQLAN
ncbi:MAG: PASTA domain-containing protein [Trueperaceae bacterium]